jgi:transcriptional regulator with XRE-family HTH domain
MESAGERVSQVRKTMGLKQKDFAKIIHVNQSTLSLIETGKRNLSEKNAVLISKACNVNYEWLMYGAESMISSPDEDEQAIVKQIMASDDAEIKRMIVEICKLTPEERRVLKGIARKFIEQ